MRKLAKHAVHLRAALGSGVSGSGGSLPADFLRQSCSRVGIACTVVGGLWAFGLVMNNLVYSAARVHEPWEESWRVVGVPASIIGVVLSIVLAILAKRLQSRPRLIIDLGLAYEVISCFLISLVMWWQPVLHGGRVSWVGVLIVVYPSIAPSTLRKTLIVSLVAASTEVIGFGIAATRHSLPGNATWFEIMWTLVPPYLCALMATIPVRVIRSLGKQVNTARELGSYRLEESIGRGGMGEVYRASHRMLARPAAIKLIRPEVLGGTTPETRAAIVERFRREADAAASLRSPHTIELYDFGVSDDGTFYYVMELLDGVDFESLVKTYGPLPPERVVSLLQQACESLAEAHARGLVHRDVKPSNVLTCRLGLEVDFVKVVDFGLVKMERPQGRDAVMLTTPEIATGTPAFMAPEASLDHAHVDSRADVYALGCVAYWLLTAELVFEADAAVQMLIKHVRDTPVPPSKRVQNAMPAALDTLVLACLAKSPEDRPQDAGALGARLDALRLETPWTLARARAWWEERAVANPPAPSQTPSFETATLFRAPLDA